MTERRLAICMETQSSKRVTFDIILSVFPVGSGDWNGEGELGMAGKDGKAALSRRAYLQE